MRKFPMRRLWFAIAAVLLVSARAGDAAPTAAATASPDSAPPRLARAALPSHQTVELTLDPEQPHYHGRVTIALDVKEPTRELRFHARAMTLDSVVLRGPSGDLEVAGVEHLVPDQVRLRLATPLAAGPHTLEIRFHKLYNTRAISLYRVVTGGRGYLFTQFEDTEAREAFPCWDEPEFKIPWTMTLTVPATDLAVSNTPIAREKRSGRMKRVEFARSQPMPSYLVAIAVGPLETVPIRGLGVPGRVVTVKGASGMAGEAVKMTPAILKSLERYFGRPYPYEKLDLIAAPEFLYGAMENAGAIVFADRRLLVDPRSVSPDQRNTLGSIIAHEIAHMWFGDLVTMKWWDDLWLNESFASWMATKVMDEVFPENQSGVTKLYAVERARAIDGRLSTRAMRAPVTDGLSLSQTAGPLTYNKGEAVLTMFEGWLGAETFRRGVVEYLNTHAWGNAEAADLWRALGKVSGENIDAAMATFLDQPGVPLVTVEPLGDGRVKLSQRRFISVGEAPNQAGWRIPVILRYPSADSVHALHAWLAGADTTVNLRVSTTPAWIMPNANASGYYRWGVPERMLESLAAASRTSLTPRERIDLIMNLTAQLRAGQLPGDHYLARLGSLADDSSPEVIRAAITSLSDTRVALVTARADSAYAAFLRTTLEPALRRFGMRPRAGEPVGVALMRPALLRLLAEGGRDVRVIAYAETLSSSYRRDPASVPASMVEPGIIVGAMRGDRAQYDDYRTRFENTKVPIERNLYLNGLGSFRDTTLRGAALNYALNGPLRPQETLVIPGATSINSLSSEGGGSGSSMYSDETVEWVLEHFDELRAKMPPNFATRIIGLGGGCSQERLDTLREFFADPENKVIGGEATLQRLNDAIRECAGVHERESERVERWLMMQGGRP